MCPPLIHKGTVTMVIKKVWFDFLLVWAISVFIEIYVIENALQSFPEMNECHCTFYIPTYKY